MTGAGRARAPTSTPEQLRDLMATEIPRWAEVVKKSGASVE